MDMQKDFQSSQELAASITKAASKQTYYTVLYLVDRQRVPDAYRAYAYFRWIDDRIDQVVLDNSERVAFIDRQKAIMDSCYRGQRPGHLSTEEHLLADLILADKEKNSGLQSYIRNMMAVIDFDRDVGDLVLGRAGPSRFSPRFCVSPEVRKFNAYIYGRTGLVKSKFLQSLAGGM